jgi:hypothetical protein
MIQAKDVVTADIIIGAIITKEIMVSEVLFEILAK